MKFLSADQGQLLFDQFEELIEQSRLTPKERVPQYRALLEELYRALMADEPVRITKLFDAGVYIINTHRVDARIAEAFHLLRVFANDVVHKAHFRPSEADDLRARFQLAEILSYHTGLDVPEAIVATYRMLLDNFRRELEQARPRPAVTELRAVVRDIDRPGGDNAGRFVTLYCENDELRTFRLRLWNNRRPNGSGFDFTELADLLWPYATIYVTAVRAHEQRTDEYAVTERSLVVLEPDYLLEAKELAECWQSGGANPKLFLFNRFTRGEITEAVMLGNLANQLLDEACTGRGVAYNEHFTRIMRENAFGMLCMANDQGTYSRERLENLYKAGERQVGTITGAARRFRHKKVLTEPTFLSPTFGLQGRLDVLLEDKQHPTQLDVVELKAGSFPKTGAWANHEAQVLVYDLLLQSVTSSPPWEGSGEAFSPPREGSGKARTGTSAILYSRAAADEDPLRNVAGDRYQQHQHLLMLRNCIVATEFALADGRREPVEALRPSDFGPVPKFSQENLVEFERVLRDLSDLEREYFYGFLRFIYGEMQVSKVGPPADAASGGDRNRGGFAQLWRASKREKEESFNGLFYLAVGGYDPERHTVTLAIENLMSSIDMSFRPGETVLLYPTPDPETPQPWNCQILKGTLDEITPSAITVTLAHKQLDPAHFRQTKYWALESDFRDSGFKSMLQQLYQFCKSDADRRALVLGGRRPLASPGPSQGGEVRTVIFNEVLTDNQQQIVQQALNARDYYLIQGPPGTGKTSKVLCEIVRQAAREETVMVIAFTNRAVDEIAVKLHQLGVDFIRLGKSDGQPYSWSTMAGQHKLPELFDRVRQTRIFLSTQASFHRDLDLLKLKRFDTLVIDEASQLLEPQLVGLLPHFRRFIMIGDDRQLPAVVVQDEKATACAEPLLRAIGLENFRESLFARLLLNARRRGWDDCHGLLRVHFRMHEDLAAFPNERFYGGQLEAGSERQRAPIVPPATGHRFDALFGQSRLGFIPVPPSRRNKVNPMEAQLVAELAAYIRDWYGDRFDPGQTVGIITPFRAQISAIRQCLPPELQGITVDTVERFQGSERDIILISFAVKSALQLRSIQSVNGDGVDRKLNVALTRGKEWVVLCGAEEVLTKDEHLAELLRRVRGMGGYVREPSAAKPQTDSF